MLGSNEGNIPLIPLKLEIADTELTEINPWERTKLLLLPSTATISVDTLGMLSTTLIMSSEEVRSTSCAWSRMGLKGGLSKWKIMYLETMLLSRSDSPPLDAILRY